MASCLKLVLSRGSRAGMGASRAVFKRIGKRLCGVDIAVARRKFDSSSDSGTFLQRGFPPPPPWRLLPGLVSIYNYPSNWSRVAFCVSATPARLVPDVM